MNHSPHILPEGLPPAVAVALPGLIRHIMTMIAGASGLWFLKEDSTIGFATSAIIGLVGVWLSIRNAKKTAAAAAKVAPMLLLALLMVGCAGKPGTDANHPEGLRLQEPSSTHSYAQLGFDGPTQIGGPLNQETSKLTPDGTMQETSGGGAAKQRLQFQHGELRVLFSASSNITGTGEMTPDGSLVKFSFTTDNASVQRAVNEGVAVLVAQWQKASDNERAVLEADIAARAKVADVVAQGALGIINLLKGVVIP
jgi:hypothetical protein